MIIKNGRNVNDFERLFRKKAIFKRKNILKSVFFCFIIGMMMELVGKKIPFEPFLTGTAFQL